MCCNGLEIVKRLTKYTGSALQVEVECSFWKSLHQETCDYYLKCAKPKEIRKEAEADSPEPQVLSSTLRLKASEEGSCVLVLIAVAAWSFVQ